MDTKAVADGDTITVYVSAADPRESSAVPKEVRVAANQRSKARAERNYTKADALHKKITDQNYRFFFFKSYILAEATALKKTDP